MHSATTSRRLRRGAGAAAALTLAVATAAAGLPATASATTGTPVAAHHRGPVGHTPKPSAATPTITPVKGTIPADPAGTRSIDDSVLRAYGYRRQEFFLSGTAHAYRFDEAPTTSGDWDTSVDPGSAAPYRIRVEVYTPVDHRHFSGNVVSEWDNVTGGNDVLPDLIWNHNTAFRDGDAYVGVSAQFVGNAAAKASDPSRYGSLDHPGDSWSYDIYSQAGMALRNGYRTILDGLKPRAVIADGESQSAGRMATYIDGVAPLVNVYDGYLVHSRGGTMFPLQEAPATAMLTTSSGPQAVPNGNVGRRAQNSPTYSRSRTDIATPVMYLMSESDVFAPPFGALDYAPATQSNSRSFRLWEMAGTSHVDDYVVQRGQTDTGSAAAAQAAFQAMLNPPTTTLGGATCDQPVNTGQEGYVLSAALEQMQRWVRTGRPASAPALFAGQRPGLATGSAPQRDAAGIIRGGVRTPAVDVPVATLTGMANTPGFTCLLSGTTTPFSAAQLATRYPTHQAFVRDYGRSVVTLTCQGYLTPADARNLVLAAARSDVGA